MDKTYYSYIKQKDGSLRIAEDPTFSVPEIGGVQSTINQVTGVSTIAHTSYRMVRFFAGRYATSHKAEQEFLDDLLERSNAKGYKDYIILRDKPMNMNKNANVIIETKVVNTISIPKTAFELFTYEQMKQVLTESFNYEANGEDEKEVLDEAINAGFVK